MTLRLLSASLIAAAASTVTLPVNAQNMMADDAMMASDMMMASDVSAMGDAMMMTGKTVQITIENLLSGQPFSPSYSRAGQRMLRHCSSWATRPATRLRLLRRAGTSACSALARRINKDSLLGDASLAIHTLPGQTRMLTVRVDEKHPLIDGVWMLGNTNDGFSGVSAVNGYELAEPLVRRSPRLRRRLRNQQREEGFHRRARRQR